MSFAMKSRQLILCVCAQRFDSLASLFLRIPIICCHFFSMNRFVRYYCRFHIVLQFDLVADHLESTSNKLQIN